MHAMHADTATKQTSADALIFSSSSFFFFPAALALARVCDGRSSR
uniref:Uncharacterized protein n=1 Tax=Zea mays TaxID=4577 RepID=C4J5C8_MAIZE|nr:unknown [Zea mays]